MVNFTVSRLSDINNIIIPHFINYPLRGNKLQDFNSWCLAAKIITEGRHLTAEGIIELNDLFKNMNRSHVSALDFLPLHCNKVSDNYIPIDGNYISGLIAGDGSIGIYPDSLTFNNKNFCSIYLGIT